MLKVFVGAGCLLGLLAVVVSTRPGKFHIERSITISAPPERAFAQVNDFHKWGAWSPYEKIDPTMTRSYSGAPSGIGAGYAWSGTGKAGEGKMTIENNLPPSIVSIKLEFTKPMVATNTATFTFAPAGGGTRVTWAMDGTANFVAKAFHMVFDMDKLVGEDFEKGLTNLKAIAEGEAQATARAAQ